ncbi:amine oxidase catalytic domain-containing protein [Coccomyxa subellipsoidea C-169]|uniref:Amine oxidase n=1 Tax=Coccomyxa subellipsoidea (strain C-169) TaxID=574566 RepID=I0Z8K3_COCSC|nr:amine oxidase catalytic domain-containing protein [Coccomyxa subellipsoidea C-169]EIE26972.1 amine oxidase catalytic domain-containing protein [Coccomyxa subellipsoidea C-169]|eukprot:XP_005651516.1 amine oxidase catalytic domain-containing protein [Coccomyxa subellipsoidea C-169]
MALVISDRKSLRREVGDFRNTTLYAERNTCPGFLDKGQAVLESDRVPSSAQPNLFEELTVPEMAAVRNYLFAQADLNLTRSDEATPASNVIYLMELQPPPKVPALAFLDSGGAVPAPPRQARVVVYLGYLEQPKVVEMTVGPLPAPTNYTILREVPWNTRPPNSAEYSAMDAVIQAASAQLEQFMTQSFAGFKYYNCEFPRCLLWGDTTPRGVTNDQRQTWIWFMRFTDGYYLKPIGLEFLVDHRGNDPSKWAVTQIFYNGQVFGNTTELNTAFADTTSGLNRQQLRQPLPGEINYASLKRQPGPGRPEPRGNAAPQAGSRQYEPSGKRYSIDRNAVSYMGWTFQVSIRPSGGIRIWDVRFGGERIAYEIALQEAMISYGGATPSQSVTQSYDTANGLGSGFHELVHGVDCPFHASYLDSAAFVDRDSPLLHPQSICVWEQDSGRPLWRHYTQEFAAKGSFIQYGGVADHALVVRGITTVYNTDYMTDFVFHLDGSIKARQNQSAEVSSGVFFSDLSMLSRAVSVGLSGYVLAAPWSGATGNYSYPLYADMGASVQDHFLNWKVDLDIKGTENSMRQDFIEIEERPLPWSVAGANGPVNGTAAPVTVQKRLRRVLPETEEDASLSLSSSRQVMSAVISERSVNKWGTPQGYQIQVDSSISQLYPDSWQAAQAGSWSRYQIATTVRRDNESSSSSIYAAAHPGVPPQPVNFSSYINGESVRNTDIVNWVTVGAYDVPTSESAPVTAVTGRELSFWLRPYNYFDRGAATDLYGIVVMSPTNYTRRAQPKYETYGVATDFSCVPSKNAAPFNRTEFSAYV